MEKNLPAIRMDKASTTLFVGALGSTLPLRETASLASLSIAEQRTAVLAKIFSLHPTITRAECDKCLGDLALVVPSSQQSEEDYDRKLDLYFALFQMHGVTRDMLRLACATYAMAPRVKGRDKFFPDPGTLFEFMADQARTRKQALLALQRALDVLDGKLLPEAEPQLVSEETRGRMRHVGSMLAVWAKGAKP